MRRATHFGMALALAVIVIPLGLLLVYSVVRVIMTDAGMAVFDQKRTEAFYVAEAGLNIAYYGFSQNNFSGTTHEPDGSPTGDTLATFLRVEYPGLVQDGDGWYRWEWNPGDDLDTSFTRSGQPEWFRFRVWFPAGKEWRVVCQAGVGAFETTHELAGVAEAALDYAFFSNGDLSEFTRYEDQTVNGKVHANGNMYIRPWGTKGLPGFMEENYPTFTLRADSVTASGRMVRYTDAWGIKDQGGTALISRDNAAGTPVLMEGKDQGQSGKGKAYDSYHRDWLDTGSAGALSRYGGVVKDGTMGVRKKQVFPRSALEPGGYYDRNSELRISAGTSGSWLSQKKFFNHAEDREVSVREIDVGALGSSGQFPSNGVIYSEVPIRLVNAHRLPGPLTVAGSAPVYLKGDFNMEFPDAASRASGISQQKPAAILTTDRIYRLSGGYDDADSYKLYAPWSPGFKASDPSRYEGDPDKVLELNCSFVDGSPTTDTLSWVKEYQGQTNPHYKGDNWGLGVTIYRLLPKPHAVFPNSDDYLENLEKLTVVHNGSTLHLQNSRMARFDNRDADPSSPLYDPTATPWVVRSYYMPPVREGLFDPTVLSNPPPLTPRVSQKLRWWTH